MARGAAKVFTYPEIRGDIRDGDIGLCRRRSMISIAGRSIYSHAWLFRWWGDHLMILEFREWIGGRAVTASSQIAQRPDRSIDVYRPRVGQVLRSAAAIRMTQMVGQPYSWHSILAAALLRIPPFCFSRRADMRDDHGYKRPYAPHDCSEAVCIAYGPKCDFVPNLAPAATEPADLARSSLLERLFTISKQGIKR